MLEACIASVGPERLLWGTDLTMDTGLAKLRYLAHILPPAELDLVRHGNAMRIFPAGSFPEA
jgi:predicted TIM-barrel fold metal-dependent hydrolase